MSQTTDAGFGSAMLEGQFLHAVLLAVLLIAATWAAGIEGAMDGGLWGLPTAFWFWLLIADTVVHQLMVVTVWRLELHGKRITAQFADTERAFRAYAVAFAILFGARFVLVTLLAVSNRGSLGLEPWIGYGVAAIVTVPAVYLFYSVRRYFGFRRAFGIDHFTPGEARDWPMVRDGIFKYTANGMYVFGIGALWIPGLALQSSAALIAAAFSHAYIWVHYFTVEKPDMRRIYG